VELIDTVFEVIDMRSFSNLWYWLALAVVWSSASHWVLGVPHDMIHRARREGGQAMQDLEDMARINVNRILGLLDQGPLLFTGLATFWLTALAVTAFWYDVEFAQAVFLLVFPLVLVGWQTLLTCHRIAEGENQGEALCHCLIVLRRWTQGIGMLAILVTALYGTWQNLSASILF
jgi:hypothetical protein